MFGVVADWVRFLMGVAEPFSFERRPLVAVPCAQR